MICVYCVNDNPFYLKAASNSISMLRQHNTAVPVKVLFFDFIIPGASPGISKDEFFQDCRRLSAEIVPADRIITDVEDNYFPLNKAALANVAEDTMLFIDGDTFIFGDVAEVIDAYTDWDFVACENKWMPNWSNDFLSTNNVSPFNSGVMLFNSGYHRQCLSQLVEVSRKIRQREHIVSEWIYSVDDNAYHREEFAISSIVAESNVKHTYFARRHCYNVLREEDFKSMRDSIIFHPYAHQWTYAQTLLKKKQSWKWKSAFKSL